MKNTQISMEEMMEAERNEFQDTIWRDMEARKNVCYYDIGDLVDYPIFPKVFNPVVAKASLFFLDNLGVKKGDRVLDAFTGSGVDAIKAIMMGAAHVTAMDNHLPAYQNIKFVIKKYSLENNVEAFYGDSTTLHGSYDLILANPPFRGDKNPKTASEKALQDKDYKTLEKFWNNIVNLRPPYDSDFRVRIVFSDVGDMAYNEKLMEDNGFKYEIVAKTKYASSIRIHVYEAKLKQ